MFWRFVTRDTVLRMGATVRHPAAVGLACFPQADPQGQNRYVDLISCAMTSKVLPNIPFVFWGGGGGGGGGGAGGGAGGGGGVGRGLRATWGWRQPDGYFRL